jgi:PmbA protein
MDDASHIVELALTMGADEAVCHIVREKCQQVRFSHNEVTAAKEFHTVRAEMYVAKGKKNTNFVLENLETIEKDLKKSVTFLDRLQENKDSYGIAKGPFVYRERECDVNIGTADVVTLAAEAITACDTDMAGVLFTRYQDIDFASPYAEASDEQAFIEMSVRAFEKGSSGHAVSCASTLKDFDGVNAAEQASDLAKRSQSPELGKEGRYDIVFTPLCFGTLLSGALYSISAFFVDAGISFFYGKIGEKVASETFSLANDGTLEEGIFAAKFDKEGVPTKRTPIIKDGVLKSYLHNTSTAAKFETETTANAGFDVPLPQNLVVAKGDKTVDALIGDIEHGLLVTNTWYTRFQNYMTGDFSTIPRDAILTIEDGVITGSVKNIRISDNMLRMLENIDGLSRDTEQIHWWECEYPVFSPFVLVRDVTITTSTK